MVLSLLLSGLQGSFEVSAVSNGLDAGIGLRFISYLGLVTLKDFAVLFRAQIYHSVPFSKPLARMSMSQC